MNRLSPAGVWFLSLTKILAGGSPAYGVSLSSLLLILRLARFWTSGGVIVPWMTSTVWILLRRLLLRLARLDMLVSGADLLISGAASNLEPQILHHLTTGRH